jgi:hypothetical protein
MNAQDQLKAGTCPYRKGTFEKAIYDFMIAAGFDTTGEEAFDVTGYELTHDGEGWSVNQPFRISSAMPAWAVIEDARARWENFKLNYFPRALVGEIKDEGEGETIDLESECAAFLTIARLPKDSE